jgi:hypothetical protein
MPTSKLPCVDNNHSNQSATETKVWVFYQPSFFQCQSKLPELVVLVNDVGVLNELGNNIRTFHQMNTNISMVIRVFHLIWLSRSCRPASTVATKNNVVLVEYL